MKDLYNRIKVVANNYKNIISNYSYLSILEIIKLLSPFIVLPYLIKTIGIEKYGLVSFTQAFASYFTILINLGLDISIVKEISINREKKEIINEIVSSVLIIKSSLFIVSIIIVLYLINTFELFNKESLLFLFSLGYCLFEVLFPIWYFQGIEKMKYITIIRFITTITFTIAVFAIIKQANDYYLIPLLQGIGAIIGGIISFYILLKKENIKLVIPKSQNIKYHIKTSIPFFISRISTIINSTLVKIISGIFLGMQQVAVFDIIDKITEAGKIPLTTLNNTVYPYIAKTKDKLFINKMFSITIIIAFSVYIIISIFANQIICIFTHGEMNDFANLLRLFSINIILCGITYYTGVPVLVSFGYIKIFNNSVILSTLILLCIYSILYLNNLFTLNSVIYCSLITESIVLLYRVFFCLKYKLIINNNNK